MNTSLAKLLISYSAACLLMTGCVYGENKAFFDESSASTIASNPLPGGTGTGSNPVDPTTTPTATPAPTAAPTATPAVVCDPLGSTGTSASAANGIKASMYYFNASERSPYATPQVSDYFNFGHKANADFYFNTVNTPTRYFSQGFQLPDGTSIKDADGNVLLENFAFDYKTSIRLPAGSGTKQKQFAILADDGANLLVQDPITGTWSTNVNNDGLHSSKLGCGTTPVTVGSDYATPIEVQYYQGPRYYIASVLLWRDWNGDASDPWCGGVGDSTFFDSSTVPSTAKAPWLDILTRWQVVPANVMFLEPQTTNPCATH